MTANFQEEDVGNVAVSDELSAELETELELELELLLALVPESESLSSPPLPQAASATGNPSRLMPADDRLMNSRRLSIDCSLCLSFSDIRHSSL